MKLKKFINECRENEVFKNLSIYIVSSWVLLQVVDLIAEPLALPETTLTYLLILLLLAFPVYIYLLWKFNISDKIKRKPLLDDTGNPVPGKFRKSPFQKLYFSSLSIISIIAVGVVAVVIDKKFVQQARLPELSEGDKIAVLRFDNNTGDPKFDIAGKMAVDWIIHGITQNKAGQVISPEIIDDYSEVLKASILPTGQSSTVTSYLKPSKIVEGEYYLNKDRLLFQCSITDEIMNKTLISFEPVDCDPDSALDCIEELKQRILGYLITAENKKLNLQETPPKFEAYQYFLQAKLEQYQNDEEHLSLLQKAIDADSMFFEPRTYQVIYYYNSGQFQIADSLLNDLTRSTGTNERQRNLLNLYESLLAGNHKNAYRYLSNEYVITPFHLETNASMMTVSLQMVNQPQAVDSIYREIDMEGLDLENCFFCKERLYIKSLSEIELGNHEEVIQLLDEYVSQKGYPKLKKVLLRAYVLSGEENRAKEILSNLQITSPVEEWTDIQLFVAKTLISKDSEGMGLALLAEITDLIRTKEEIGPADSKVLAECLLLKGDYMEARELLVELVRENKGDMSQFAMLAIVNTRLGDQKAAVQIVEEMEANRAAYQYGSIDYALAQYYAYTGDEDNMNKSLLKAVAEGYWYDPYSFRYDPFLKPYAKTESFERIMKFWH